MKNIIRKISSVLGSAVLIGMTMASAVAANYPQPFVNNGMANVAIVYGANADLSDVVGSATISSSLAAELASQTASGETTVTGGDSYLFGEGTSTKFHIGDNLTAIKSTLDEDELPTLLAQGKFIDNDNDEFDYTQKIVIGPTLQLNMWESDDYMEDEPTVGFKIPSGQVVMNYTITFSDEPLMTDLATANLPLMGKEYYVLSNTSAAGVYTLTLLDSATDTILTEGETSTLNVDGTPYTASIDYISSSEAKLTVNGETTNSLAEGSTYKLSDGAYVGIKDIMYDVKDTGISKVEFSVGSGKLKLASGSNVQINDVSVSELTSTIVNSTTPGLTSIRIDWVADTDMFIVEGEEITMPKFENVKISYGGAVYPEEETVTVGQGADYYATLNNFPLKNGPTDIDFLYGNATNGVGFIGIGKSATAKLVTSVSSSLTFDKTTDDTFIASWSSSTEGESYLMRANNFGYRSDGTTSKTDIEYYDGDSKAWVVKKDVKETDSLSMGNVELTIGAIDRVGQSVALTAVGSTNFYELYTKEGLRTYLPFNASATDNGNATTFTPGMIFLPGSRNSTLVNVTGLNGTSFYLQFAEEDKSDTLGAGGAFNVSVGWDSSTVNEVEVSDLIGENVTAIEIQDTDVERSFMYSELATEFLWNKPSSGQNSIKIIYHGDEVLADVYVTSADATVGQSGDELGTVTVTDAEAASVAGKNLIVVGGSAINSVAAELLGGALRGAAFEDATSVGAGEFLIESFSRGGKVALLVAGYNAADTTKAVTYLTNNAVDTTVGNKLVGTSATEATVVTA